MITTIINLLRINKVEILILIQIDTLSSQLELKSTQLSSSMKEQHSQQRRVKELDSALTETKVCLLVHRFAITIVYIVLCLKIYSVPYAFTCFSF